MGSAPAYTIEMQEFAGSARFTLLRRLGSGGFGTVYEALDQEHGAVVALKLLTEQWGEALYLFKQEFRSLADLSHRNLVTLYELFNEGPHWFFTMELLRGHPFLAQAHSKSGTPTHTPTQAPSSSNRTADLSNNDTLDPAPAFTSSLDVEGTADLGNAEWTANSGNDDTPTPTPISPGSLVPDGVLCDILLQVTEGLLYLHGAGKLHRDLKPANVLITEQGRAVILDFGLAMEVTDTEASTQIIGTPTYMSPEQAAGAAVGPATDWYSFGVMLFQALTGGPPFVGSGAQVLRKKRTREAPRASSRVAGLTEDWDELCAELLRRNPSERLVGEAVRGRLLAIRARLGGAEAAEVMSAEAPAKAMVLVGRQREQAALKASYAEVQKGRTVVSLLHGTSGMGKSTLCRQFLYRLEHEAPQVVVLTGRCYQHEQVSFKAMDGVVDMLSRYLKRLPDEDVRKLLPRDIAMLCQLFPVLKRVPAVLEVPERSIEDPRERKRVAFVALRELFQQLAVRQPVVVHIDDLQWGDLDSVALIMEILRAPDAPAVLLILAYRSEDREGEVVTALRATLSGELFRAVAVRDLELGGLDQDEARQLLSALLNRSDVEAVEEMVQEAGGNPFFLQELAQDARPRLAGERMTLEQMVRRRVQRLPEEAQRLLEVVCVAGHPLPRTTAGQAVLGQVEPQSLTQLRVSHLLRLRGSGKREELVPYHDRIRESVAAGLSTEKRRHVHLRLAEVLEHLPENRHAEADSQQVMHHYLEAGELERAAPHALKAVAQAQAALAFDQASRLCEQTLALPGLSAEQIQSLRVQLADCLAGAGRPYHAAQAYLRAAEKEPKHQALEHRLRSMNLLLFSGYGEEGKQLLQKVVADAGLPSPVSKIRTMLVFLFWFYIWLPLRGRGFREHTETEVGADELLRNDICADAAMSMQLGHSPRHWALWYWFWFSRRSYRAGEPGRVAIALSFDGFFATLSGNREKGERLNQLAAEIVKRSQNPYHIAWVTQTAGLVHFHAGEWEKARTALERADALVQKCPWAAAQRAYCRFYHCASLWGQGAVQSFTQAATALLKETQEQGHIYYAATTQAYLSGANLVADEPNLAWETLQRVLEKHSENYLVFGIVARLEPGILLYKGRWKETWELAQKRWNQAKSIGALTYAQTRILLRSGLAQAALALYAEQPNDKRWLRIAAEQIRALRREYGPWPAALTVAFRASLARLRGANPESLRLIQEAEQRFRQADMALHAAAAQRRRGEWGQESALIETSVAFMSAQGIKNSERMSNLLMPI